MASDRSSFRSAPRSSRAALGLSALAATAITAACSDAATGPSRPTTISTNARLYLDSALAFEAALDYWWANVDSAGQHNDVFKVAGVAQTYRNAWPAAERSINPWLVNADPAPGGDQHSAFFPDSEAPGVVNAPSNDSRYLAQGRTLALSGRTSNVGYLWLPTYDGTNDQGRTDSIQTVIRTLDQQSPCGWIIDLRFNPGGTWAVMLAGINPILGDQPFGNGQNGFLGIVDRDGYKSYLFVAGGKAGLRTPAQTGGQGYYKGDTAVYNAAPTNYTLRRPNSPVAILQGDLTASAGEEIVLAFRGLTSFPVRTFGAATYGVTTAPAGAYMYQLLSGADSSFLNIVNGVDFDRTGQLWGGAISPTQAVSGPSGVSALPATSAASDPVVAAATSWLATQSACGGTAIAERSQVPGPAYTLARAANVSGLATSAASGAERTRSVRPSKFHIAQQPRRRLRNFAFAQRSR